MWLKSVNGRDVKRAIIDVNSIVSGRNSDILTSIIAQMLMSKPISKLCHLSLSLSLSIYIYIYIYMCRLANVVRGPSQYESCKGWGRTVTE